MAGARNGPAGWFFDLTDVVTGRSSRGSDYGERLDSAESSIRFASGMLGAGMFFTGAATGSLASRPGSGRYRPPSRGISGGIIRTAPRNSAPTIGRNVSPSSGMGGGFRRSPGQAPAAQQPYILFNRTHAGAQPVPRGLGPNGGRLQSHHGLQQEWAANNLPGYDPRLAPTVTIETGQGFPHSRISALQNARRDARVAAGQGRWSSTVNEELGHIVTDFRAAGFGDDVIRQTLQQQYQMLDSMGVAYTRPSGF